MRRGPSSADIRGGEQRRQGGAGRCRRQRVSTSGADGDGGGAAARGRTAAARHRAARVARVGPRGGRLWRRARGVDAEVARPGTRHRFADAGAPQALRATRAHPGDVRALPGRRLGRRARAGLQIGRLKDNDENRIERIAPER